MTPVKKEKICPFCNSEMDFIEKGEYFKCPNDKCKHINKPSIRVDHSGERSMRIGW